MREPFRTLLLCIGAALLLFATAYAAESGVSYSLSSTGTLYLTGSGDIPGFNYSYVSFVGYATEAPWFENRGKIKTVEIQDGITGIGTADFADCTWLRIVYIPSSVKTIGKAAFGNCVSLAVVFYGGTETQWSAVTVEEQNEALDNVTVLYNQDGPSENGYPKRGRGGQNIGWSLDENGLLTISGTGEMNTYSSPSWTDYKSQIKEVKIESGVTTVSVQAFMDCSELVRASIPPTVESLEEAAFYQCKKLSDVTLSEGLKSIGNRVFTYCESLENVTIPDTVESIGIAAFSSCSKLSKVSLPNSLVSIGDNAFAKSNSLETIMIPNGLKEIGEMVFYYSGITNVTIPQTVEKIGHSAFSSSSITSITIPGTVQDFEDTIFFGCDNLEDARIEEGIAIIPEKMFYLCSALNTVYIPRSVKEIGENAFNLARNIKDVYYAGSQEEWDKITIQDGNENLTGAALHCNDEPCVPVTVTGTGTASPAYLPYIPDSTVFCVTFADSGCMVSCDLQDASTDGLSFTLPEQSVRAVLMVLDDNLVPLNMKRVLYRQSA